MDHTKITELDALLLRELQKNARITNKELARIGGVAESTCLERVRSLQQRGIVRGWRAEVDLAAIGRPIQAMISVRLQPKTTESVQTFQAEVLAAPQTLCVTTVTGADDFIVEVAVAEIDELWRFVLDHITGRPDVADSRTSLVYDQQRPVLVQPMVGETRS
jgi:DNA-binding Lrp family transcriptional regulator